MYPYMIYHYIDIWMELYRGCHMAMANIPPEELSTGRRKIVRKTFVEEKQFLLLYKDTAHAELFSSLVTEHLNANDPSESTSGYWIQGDVCSHLPGHHLIEDYADAAVRMSRTHEDGSTVLHEDQAKDKYRALTSDRLSDAKRADEYTKAHSDLLKSRAGSAKVLALMQIPILAH
jgi:hypothetical protein